MTVLRWFQFSGFFQMAGVSAANLLPLYWMGMGYDEISIGYLNAISLSLPLIGPVLFGWMGSHYAPHKILRWCFLGSALAAVFMFFFRDFWSQALSNGVVVLLRCGIFTLVPVGVLHILGKRAGVDYARYRKVGSLGFLVGGAGAGYIARYSSAAAVLWFFVVTVLIAGWPYLSKLKIPFLKEQRSSYREVLKQDSWRLFFLSMVLIQFWLAPAFVFLPIRLEEMGVSEDKVGWILGMCGLVAMITWKLCGRIVDKFPIPKLLMIVPFTVSLRILSLGWPAENYQWFFLLQWLHVPALVFSEVLQVKYVRNFAKPHEFPRVQALLTTSIFAGNALGVLLFTETVARFGLRSAFYYYSLLPLLAFPLLWKLQKIQKS